MATGYVEIRQQLSELGDRRIACNEEDEAIKDAIKEALRDAGGNITMQEAADLLRIHRTTLYRVYT